jgi:large subunit ribosomal protein L35
MPKQKLKTKKNVIKRFKVTGTGKIKIKRLSGRGHLLAHKSSKRKRQLKRQPLIQKSGVQLIKKQIGI